MILPRWAVAAWLWCYWCSRASCTHLVPSTVMLPPPAAARGDDISVVFLHGAKVAPAAYVPVMKAVQVYLQEEFRVWVNLPASPLLGSVDDIITKARAAVEEAGAVPKYTFVAGHSAGAAQIQAYCNDSSRGVTGQVLYAATLLSAYNNLSYPTPTLTVGGEKDGMTRITRLAEAAYVYRSAPAKFPVFAIKGASHMSFASGAPPRMVRLRDLRPEVNESVAHDAIARVTAGFIRQQATGQAPGDDDEDKRLREESSSLLAPMIDALLMEGSHHIQRPCNSDHPSPHCPWYPAWPLQDYRSPSNDTECTCGCNWTQTVPQALIGGLADRNVTYLVVDAFHNVKDTEPYHHAHLWNNCTTEQVDAGSCVLNMTTVSQLIYPRLDPMDTGFSPSTASEIRVKMKSRQVVYMATVNPEAKLEDTDAEPFCAQINARAYQWALSHAPEHTLSRFETLGVPMVFDDDIRHPWTVGPLWINHPLKLQEQQDPGTGEWFLHVQSITMVTDANEGSWYPDSDGYHYCKLLSPARAMEWIYVDGLRRHDGLQSAEAASALRGRRRS